MRIFNKKHVFVLILLMLCIFTVTSVSASDLNATDVGLIEDMSDNILNDETTKLTSVEESDEVLVLDNQSNTLSATYYPTSVSQLKSDISSANAGDTIVLSGTYKIHDYTISKELTFIGTNGATFDGEDNRIFGIENSIVTFKNITFKNGYGRYGGTIDAYSGQVIFDNCKFLKSYAAYRGGTLFISGTAYCKITNSYFTNSKVGDGSGGAICIENSGEIINCTIEGCSATEGNGGAIVSRGANNIKIIDSTVINCRAIYGGAIRIQGNSRELLIDNCTFKNNVASQDGGAISRYESSSVDIINSNFEGNSAPWGGAVYLKYTDGTISNCTFKNNHASSDSGAVSGGVLTDCTFIGNTADDCGGAGAWGSYYNCNFINNSAKNFGGAIKNGKSIENCTFINNAARMGGSIRFDSQQSNVVIKNCDFIKSSANNGGAIYIGEGFNNIKILNSTFKSCTSSEGSSAVDIFKSNNIVINNSKFEDCSGKSSPVGFYGTVNDVEINGCEFYNTSSKELGGGAICSNGGNYLKIKDIYFEKCQAHTYGGAMDIYGVKDVNIIDCDFYECFTVVNDGGAISSDSCSNINILGCDFDSCKSNGFGGSVRVVNTGNLLTISDCNFSDSYSNMEGGSVYSKNVPNVIIDNCDFLNSSSNLTGGSVCILTTTNANLNDLYFKDSDSGNFAGSLYINDVTNFNLSNSEFINSHAKMTGGAIHVNPATNLNISDCLFDSCSAELYGNSLDIGFTKNTIIKNSNFTNSNYNGQEAITFPGSEKYEILDSIFDVTPKEVICHYNTILSADDFSIVNGEQCTIRATLSNVAGPLSNKQVTFSVNGNSYSRTTSSDGIVSFNAKEYIGGLGSHEVIVSYAGDSINSEVSKTINVKVNMYRATLTVTPYGKYYGDKSLSFKVVGSDNKVKSYVPIHVDIYLNGNLYQSADISTDPNGMVTYSMSSFEPGNYSVKAYVTTQNVDVNTVEMDNIVISKISGVIELSTSNNNKTLNIKLVNPVNGDVYGSIPVKLQFNPNGYETAVTTDSSGCVSVPLMFGLGTYGVVASVDSSGFKEFPIAELQNIVISTAGKDDSVVKFNNAIVFDYLKSGSTTLTLEGCTVIREKVSVDGHPEASIVVSGNKITVSGLAAGSYTLRVVSTPDEYHNSVTRTVGITVNKVDSSITIAKPVSFSYGDSGSTNVNVNGGSVDFNGVSVDGHPEAFIGVVNNAITVSNLPVGSYTLRITSTPDSNHKAVTKTTTITVSKVDSKISFDKAISFVYGKSGSAALTLTGCGIVREGISVDGHPEAIIDVNNNVVTVSNLSVGGYTLRITSVPDSNHNAVTDTIVVTVSKADSDVKFSKAINYDYGGSGSTNLILTGCSVTLGNIKVDNHPEAVIRINGNVVSVSNLAVGSYTLRVTSTPDSNHNAVTRTVGVTVNKASSKVGFSNPIEFDYLGSGSTTLILEGCTVSLSNLKVIGHDEALISINSNNVVSVSGLNAGNYTLSVESTPDENHRSSTATLSVTVNKLDSDLIFIENSISFKYSKSGSTAIVLDNCKVASMSIEGKSVKPVLKDNVITVSGLAVGRYVLKVITQPVNSNYNSVVRSIPVVVIKNTAKITVKKQIFAYKKAGNWAITLKDSSGKSISKVKVTLKVYTGKKFKPYTSTATNSNGVAYFNLIKYLSLGNHKVIVSFSHAGYTCKSVSSVISVVKQTPLKFIVTPKTTAKGFSISIVVKDKTGKRYVNGVKVKLTIGSGKNMKSIVLVSGNYGKGKGVCAYSTNMLPAGTHKVTVTSAVVNYAGSASSKVTLKASAKKYGNWWEKISSGRATSAGLK
ncbi:right-handed parallel beta-helix repeat-containing protein [uncultured Methanobrevibacter sp.]|uniref:right-handed parallel beta-helix repeat-containing protein n=1 Tax=uncultured Methanobrevibacter sp. TaxID=253161 RepID=UPI0025E30670|nr:right-handed parallel beta-helix repeat-containing protein [uncultured Methanobrevibacter sp.]